MMGSVTSDIVHKAAFIALLLCYDYILAMGTLLDRTRQLADTLLQPKTSLAQGLERLGVARDTADYLARGRGLRAASSLRHQGRCRQDKDQ